MPDKEKYTVFKKVERSLHLMLSDFMRLFTPNSKKVFTWLEIALFSLFIGFLCLMCYLAI